MIFPNFGGLVEKQWIECPVEEAVSNTSFDSFYWKINFEECKKNKNKSKWMNMFEQKQINLILKNALLVVKTFVNVYF